MRAGLALLELLCLCEYIWRCIRPNSLQRTRPQILVKGLEPMSSASVGNRCYCSGYRSQCQQKIKLPCYRFPHFTVFSHHSRKLDRLTKALTTKTCKVTRRPYTLRHSVLIQKLCRSGEVALSWICAAHATCHLAETCHAFLCFQSELASKAERT